MRSLTHIARGGRVSQAAADHAKRESTATAKQIQKSQRVHATSRAGIGGPVHTRARRSRWSPAVHARTPSVRFKRLRRQVHTYNRGSAAVHARFSGVSLAVSFSDGATQRMVCLSPSSLILGRQAPMIAASRTGNFRSALGSWGFPGALRISRGRLSVPIP